MVGGGGIFAVSLWPSWVVDEVDIGCPLGGPCVWGRPLGGEALPPNLWPFVEATCSSAMLVNVPGQPEGEKLVLMFSTLGLLIGEADEVSSLILQLKLLKVLKLALRIMFSR